MSYFWTSLIVFILFTLIFFLVISENANINRCPYVGGDCFDGNGKYQYKGRGSKKDDVSILLSRIDWLAKNNCNKPLYTNAYIISYAIILAIIIIMYATDYYFLSPWQLIILLFSIFIITFSIMNLFLFHTDRYSDYYIRENIDYISDQLGIKVYYDPNRPDPDTYVPHRTKVRDLLYK